MFIWKRRLGEKVIAGNDMVVVVKSVEDNQGNEVRGAYVSLGFQLPYGVRVMKAETFLETQLEKTVPFPYFYRIRSTASDTILGYSFILPAEVDYHHVYELVEDYSSMIEEDDRLTIMHYRSQAEATACMQGAELLNDDDVSIIMTRRDPWHLVMVTSRTYGYGDEDNNPIVRVLTPVADEIMRALIPERRD